ncbi:MAG: hypothetical protein LAP38_03260 [Acidobacteriia bacterium]|nr:hypothetical protein [Terriglobia bacterium]
MKTLRKLFTIGAAVAEGEVNRLKAGRPINGAEAMCWFLVILGAGAVAAGCALAGFLVIFVGPLLVGLFCTELGREILSGLSELLAKLSLAAALLYGLVKFVQWAWSH